MYNMPLNLSTIYEITDWKKDIQERPGLLDAAMFSALANIDKPIYTLDELKKFIKRHMVAVLFNSISHAVNSGPVEEDIMEAVVSYEIPLEDRILSHSLTRRGGRRGATRRRARRRGTRRRN